MTEFNDISGGSTCPSQLLSWGSVWGVKFSPRQTGLSIKIGQSRTDLDIFVGTLCPWLSGVSMPGDGFFPAWRKAEARWILWPGKKTTNIARRGFKTPKHPFSKYNLWCQLIEGGQPGFGSCSSFLPPPLPRRPGRLAGTNLFLTNLAGWQVITCRQAETHCEWLLVIHHHYIVPHTEPKWKKQVAANISKSHFFKQFSM